MSRLPRQNIPLMGYCDICTPSNGVMHIFRFNQKGNGATAQGVQYLCAEHLAQEVRNNRKAEAVTKQNYGDRLYSAFLAIFPNNNKP